MRMKENGVRKGVKKKMESNEKLRRGGSVRNRRRISLKDENVDEEEEEKEEEEKEEKEEGERKSLHVIL